MVGGEGGGGEATQHGHEGAEEGGRKEVAAQLDKLVQADVPLGNTACRRE